MFTAIPITPPINIGLLLADLECRGDVKGHDILSFDSGFICKDCGFEAVHTIGGWVVLRPFLIIEEQW